MSYSFSEIIVNFVLLTRLIVVEILVNIVIFIFFLLKILLSKSEIKLELLDNSLRRFLLNSLIRRFLLTKRSFLIIIKEIDV